MTLPSDKFSSRFDRALIFACLAHDGKPRKGKAFPYIMHPVHVARLLDRHGFSEDVVIAGLLHDVLEDAKFGDARLQAALQATFGEFDDIEPCEAAFRAAAEAFIGESFGESVLELVRSVTEGKGDGPYERPWLERKEEQLAHIPAMTRDQAALKAADALHNCRSSLHDIHLDGVKTFGRFNGSGERILWYLGASTDALGHSALAGHPLQLELTAAASEFAEEVKRLRASEAVALPC